MTDPTKPDYPYQRGYSDGATDGWHNGYAAARRHYGDAAPIALDKIRAEIDRWDDTASDQFAAIEHLAEIAAILDTATEHK